MGIQVYSGRVWVALERPGECKGGIESGEERRKEQWATCSRWLVYMRRQFFFWNAYECRSVR
jgi:hypothetical protein